MIDILNIQPSVVTRTLKDKYILIYGVSKIGKTSFAASFPKNLLLGFEKGWNALGGVLAQDITSWSDFLSVLRQLRNPKAKEMYDTITIDTVSIMWDYCEEYICSKNGVSKISEIPWGAGYKELTNEFERGLRQITHLGYGLILICHNAIRLEEGENDTQIAVMSPALNKRCYEVVNRLVDIIAYIEEEYDAQGNSKRYLYTRKTPVVMAGSRFRRLPPKIEFGYQQLVDAVIDAIDETKELDGVKTVDYVPPEDVEEELNYDDLKQESLTLWKEITTKKLNQQVLDFIEEIFGEKKRLSEITPEQTKEYQQVNNYMKGLLSE